MKDSEKKLITDLFKKLKNISLDTPNKDTEAEKFINYLFQNSDDSLYYMVQTLLVQDMVIQELNRKNHQLKMKSGVNKKSSSFLSNNSNNGFLGSNTRYNTNNMNDDHYDKQKYFEKNNFDQNYSYNHGKCNKSGGISSFLGNILQTTVGVAGGMVAGNMLTNLLYHHDFGSNASLHHHNHSLNLNSDDNVDHTNNSIHNTDTNQNDAPVSHQDHDDYHDDYHDDDMNDMDDMNDLDDNFL
ncbi:DUF2076 domain-containing protein [Buchnera aphidicola]|uniref:DUF2076 domain-containing protein n=1 Tax=Buchnera aphidicola TaxID=9 RepID=UPI003464572B